MSNVESYPLHWPEGTKRTAPSERDRARFQCTFDRSRRELFDEIERLGGEDVILSTNVPLRKDGNSYASFRRVDDVGVAAYFKLNGKSMVFACDKWDLVEHNLRAVTKTIEAIRGIERWGSSDMLQRAFRGFAALPAASDEEWWAILGVSRYASETEIKAARKAMAKRYHPDLGTEASGAMMAKVNAAYERGMEAMGKGI